MLLEGLEWHVLLVAMGLLRALCFSPHLRLAAWASLRLPLRLRLEAMQCLLHFFDGTASLTVVLERTFLPKIH